MIKLSLTEKLNILFGVIMFVVYLFVGFLILFSNFFLPNVEDTYKKLFGAIIVIYALYRMYKVYLYYNRAKVLNSGINDEDEED